MYLCKSALRIFFVLMISTPILVGCNKTDQTSIKEPENIKALSPITTSNTVAEFSFEKDFQGWKSINAKDASIKLDSTIKHSGSSSLNFFGQTAIESWNYIVSDKLSLDGGKKYKLSGWVYVESINSIKAPFLKVAVQNATNPPKFLNNFNSGKYDLKKIGTWQELSTEFTTPSEYNLDGFMALQKGTNSEAINAVIYIDDLRLEQVSNTNPSR